MIAGPEVRSWKTKWSQGKPTIWLLALAALLLITNGWFTEIDDECAIIDKAVQPLSDIIRLYVRGSGQHEHPPLFDLILHGWLSATGGNYYLLRLPSILFYVFGAWILSLIAKRIGGTRSQLLQLTIIFVWPFGFHFARLTTWYSFCFFLVSLLTLIYFRFLDHPTLTNWFWFLLTCIAMVYANYLGWALLACLAVDYVRRNRNRLQALRIILGASAVLFLTYLPLVHPLLRETHVGIHTSGLLGILTADIYNVYCLFVSESVAPWFWLIGVPALIATLIGSIALFLQVPSSIKAFYGYFFIILTLMAGLGILNPKRLLFISPWLLLPLGITLGTSSSGFIRRLLVASLIFTTAVGWFGIFSRRLYSAPHWVEPWRAIAERGADVVKQHGIVIGNNPSFFFYLTYMLPTSSVSQPASGFRGLLPNSVRTLGVFTPEEWHAAKRPLASTILLVVGQHYPTSSAPTDAAVQSLDTACSLVSAEHMVHDSGAELKTRITGIYQPVWRVEIRTYRCGGAAYARSMRD
jgi:hypothetical protein